MLSGVDSFCFIVDKLLVSLVPRVSVTAIDALRYCVVALVLVEDKEREQSRAPCSLREEG